MLELVMKTLSRNWEPEVTSKIKEPLQDASRPNSSGSFPKTKVCSLPVGEATAVLGVSGNGVLGHDVPGTENTAGSIVLGRTSFEK
jgi:hypothetical protein